MYFYHGGVSKCLDFQPIFKSVVLLLFVSIVLHLSSPFLMASFPPIFVNIVQPVCVKPISTKTFCLNLKKKPCIYKLIFMFFCASVWILKPYNGEFYNESYFEVISKINPWKLNFLYHLNIVYALSFVKLLTFNWIFLNLKIVKYLRYTFFKISIIWI